MQITKSDSALILAGPQNALEEQPGLQPRKRGINEVAFAGMAASPTPDQRQDTA